MNKKIKIVIGVVALILIIGGGLYLAKNNQQKMGNDTIKIGAVLPITGTGAYYGDNIRKGMDFALEEINKNGNVLNFIYEDTQSKTDVAVTATQKLINADKVNVIYTTFSGPSLAISPIVKSSNIPFFYSSFTQTPLAENELSFKGYLNYDEPCEKFAKHLKDNGGEKVAILNEFGDAYIFCKNGLKKYYSDKDIEVIEALKDVDFRTTLLKLKQKSTDGIVVMAYESNASNIFKQIKELRLEFGGLLASASGAYTDAIKEKVGYVPNLITFDALLKETFLNKTKARFGSIENLNMDAFSQGYEDAMRLYVASTKCQNLDQKCFVSALVENNESYVYAEAPIKNRSYYAKLKYILVEADGSETELNL